MYVRDIARGQKFVMAARHGRMKVERVKVRNVLDGQVGFEDLSGRVDWLSEALFREIATEVPSNGVENRQLAG